MFSTISHFWDRIQGSLFPELEEQLGPLTKKLQQVVAVLEVCKIEHFLPRIGGGVGRPKSSRAALARAFVAKAVLNTPTNRALIDRIQMDSSLRRICGWETRHEIPKESTFSRAFSEFSESELPRRVHDALVSELFSDQIVLHVSRDSTAIEAREKPLRKEKKAQEAKEARAT